MRRRGVIVVGTDTGVGKTRVAAGIVRWWRRMGRNPDWRWSRTAVPWKPFATGVDPTRIAAGEDADLLLRAAGWGPERLADVSPVRLPLPRAPLCAAEHEGVRIDPREVLERMPQGDAFVVVEGCGGLLVPISPGYDLRDFCRDLDLPLIVVARPALGTINHVSLTLEAARGAGLRIAGLLFSGWPGDDAGTARDSLEFCRRTFDVRVGTMPRVESPDDVDALADVVGESDAAVFALDCADTEPHYPRTDRLVKSDRHALWHPFTQMKQWMQWDPVVIERAKGPWLFDADGNRYLDGVSSLWTTVHGHAEPAIDAAVRAQLGKVAHTTLLGLASVPSIELAEQLLKVAPRNLQRVFYSDSGSTAVEVALKMAFQRATQVGEPRRTLFVRFDGAYHGDTVGAVSVGGIDLFHRIFGPMLFQSIAVPAPYAYRRPAGISESDYAAASLAALKDVMRARGDEIAAVVVEPVMQGAAGMIPQPPGWLPRVAAATKAAGALLVCDEVATGFGRTGKMFAVEHEGIEPDLMCVAKGLTGGYLPLAATLATERVFEAFLGEPHENRTFFHGHSYTGNPLACAAAIANLRLMHERKTADEAARKGERLSWSLDAAIGDHPNVGDIRRRGMMVGIELVKDRATKEALDVKERVAWRVCQAALDHELRIRPLGDVVVLMPPLGIDDALLVVLVEKLRAALHDVLPECG
jgi:adenosylmethionine-8-amino-7-oxononanoate aminotransferase